MLTDIQLGKFFVNYLRERAPDRIVYVADVYELMAEKYSHTAHPMYRSGTALDVEWTRVMQVRCAEEILQPQTYVLGRAVLSAGLILPVPTTLSKMPTKVLTGDSYKIPSLPSMLALRGATVLGQALLTDYAATRQTGPPAPPLADPASASLGDQTLLRRP